MLNSIKKNFNNKSQYFLKIISNIIFVGSVFYIFRIFYENSANIENTVNKLELLDWVIIFFLSIVKCLSQNVVSYFFSIHFLNKISFIKFTKIYFYTSILNEAVPHYGTIYKGILFKKLNMSYFNYISSSFFSRFAEILSCFFLIIFFIFFLLNELKYKLSFISIILALIFLFIYLKNLKLNVNFVFFEKFFNKIKIFFMVIKKINLKIIIISLFLINISDFFIYYIFFSNFSEVSISVILTIYFIRFISKNFPIIQISPAHISIMTYITSIFGLRMFEGLAINLGHTLVILLSLIIVCFFIYLIDFVKKITTHN